MSTPQTPTASSKPSDKKATPPPAADPKAATATPKTETPKTEAAKTDAASNGSEGTPTDVDTAEPKERQKVYIVVGQVHEFKNASEAEKFLNKSEDAPKGDYTVIKGKKVEKKAKVSLR